MKFRKSTCMIMIGCMFLIVGCQKIVDETKDLEDVIIQKEEKEQAVDVSSYPRTLTSQECEEFTEWICQRDHYGFLLSDYERPQEINWDEVFYAGAGLEMDAISEEETRKYLAVVDQEEIYTDINRLTAMQIEEFVQKKTGLSYQEMERPLSWVYLPEEKLYFSEHGDTNYMNFTCVSGQQTDDEIYELQCIPGEGEEDLLSYYSPCVLTLKKSGADYQFCSNRFVEGFDEK